MDKHNNSVQTILSSLIIIPKMILRLEWVWIALMIYGFWYRSPPFRDEFVFLLGFAVPIYIARLIVHGRLFTRTPLDVTFIIFVLASLYNFYNAPVSRADYWVLLCRPLLGILIVYYFVESARINGHLRFLISVTILLGILVGGMALVASQWGASTKSDLFAFIIDVLPVLDYRQVLPDMQLSFNPNEIAGALAYFCPFLFAVALGSFVTDLAPAGNRFQFLIHGLIRYGAMIGFVLVALALFLGQSRFALFGVFMGLFLVILFVLQTWKWRAVGLTIWGVFLLLEVLIVTNALPLNQPATTTAPSPDPEPSVALNERDERMLSSRFDLWESALRMVRHYPATGAGMSTYRALIMNEEYITPLYKGRQYGPPHAHNAFFQLGADFGIIGFVLFIGWYGIIAGMAWRTYQTARPPLKIMTIAITGGILAYMGYGLGDTITLWDRFAFLHWWFIGLMTALYILYRQMLTHHRSPE